jgi:DNA-binding transcriptional regulator YhcF (GntR family)
MSWLNKPHRGHATEIRTPLARTDELIVEEIDAEVLIYDQRTNEAHCLTPAAARVWRACDGESSREQLATELELDADTVQRALVDLEACGLLDGIADPGVTRREATTRFAKLGAAAAAAPLIYSIVSPIPAAAATLTAQCQAINTFAGHDCGTKVGQGCKSIDGCCCCHSPTKAPLNPGVCTNDLQHCCTSPAGCTAGGGSPCS